MVSIRKKKLRKIRYIKYSISIRKKKLHKINPSKTKQRAIAIKLLITVLYNKMPGTE